MSIGERAFRGLLLLYPPRFRREYRDAMTQLYRDERRDHSLSWSRIAFDTLVSIPIQHKEALRAMTTSGKLVAAAVATTAAIVVFAAVGGAIAALLLMLLLAWILVSLLKARDTRAPRGAWWKFAATGAGIFVVAFVFFAGPWPQSWRDAMPGEIWWVGFFAFATAIVCLVVGLLAGVVELGQRRRATR